MRLPRRGSSIGIAVAIGATTTIGAQVVSLRPASDFSAIRDQRARSVALFEEAAKVMTSARCLNCHPSTRQPTQGDDRHAHIPPVYAGPTDEGIAGLPCASCHGTMNAATRVDSIASVPGEHHWRLAPASMAWQGKSLGDICVQLKDPARNGGRSLAKIEEHVASDPLVGWAWRPGDGRTPAPGTQAGFGSLIKAWIATGAECPQP
jgi:hypothetical protein